jgi:hypothetical protein
MRNIIKASRAAASILLLAGAAALAGLLYFGWQFAVSRS